MANRDQLVSREVASTLKIVYYSALVLLLVAVVLRSARSHVAGYLAYTGVAVTIAAPVAGVIAAAVVSLRRRETAIFLASLLILAVFALALVLSL